MRIALHSIRLYVRLSVMCLSLTQERKASERPKLSGRWIISLVNGTSVLRSKCQGSRSQGRIMLSARNFQAKGHTNFKLGRSMDNVKRT